jgi:hypothetical protein
VTWDHSLELGRHALNTLPVEPRIQPKGVDAIPVTPGSKAELIAHSMCAQKSSLHTYRTENGYRITNVTI